MHFANLKFENMNVLRQWVQSLHFSKGILQKGRSLKQGDKENQISSVFCSGTPTKTRKKISLNYILIHKK
jgi:hypothetical protein